MDSRNTADTAGDEDHPSCAACESHASPLYFCNACDCTFCASCWDRQPAHKNKKASHEKTDHVLVQKVRRVLSAPTSAVAQEDLFREDANTTWFGIERDYGGPLMFQDYGKYAELLNITRSGSSEGREHPSSDASSTVPWGNRTPSLVSFVGQTGAGKSTVIKFLVEFYSQTAQRFAAPVVGASGADIPSSEDVHLYMDPFTAASDTPILYADCEGLEGGEREPLGAIFKKRRALARHPEDRGTDQALGHTRYCSELELAWANSSNTRSREFAVSNLYPRLLYTFSDTIVFVLRNPRVVESVFQRLVEWAAAALEKSSNQPILPHAVIVFNDSPLDIDPVEWDIDIATEKLLASLKDTIFQNTVLQGHVRFWRERGRRIDKLEDLLLAYYGSLQIVRVPTNGRPNLMKEQVIRLYSSIQWACTAARQRKAALRMLLDAEELQSYLQCAFEHYAKTLDVPFDFVQASFTLSPIPLDFGGNILKLALNLMDTETDARVIFQKLGYMVASCIMLDSVRHKIKGTADHIFPQYLNHLDAALIDFCARHWPCEFVAGDGSKCVNVQSGHGSKGHQDRGGKVLAVGDYVSHFSFENSHEDFRNAVYFHLEDLLGQLRQRVRSGESQDIASAKIHKDVVMARFYSHSIGDQASAFRSHSVCFSCLCEPPQHALPCGHVLCTSCVKSYGRASNRTLVELDECPMEAHSSGRNFPYTVYLKPKTAGIRVLALDGAGICGIIQIEILRMIEQAFHGRIPIQYFFDLIVGDGFSGVFALGLAARHWSIEECTENFETICRQAFMRRTGGNIPGISWFIDNYRSKFQSRPLQRALTDTLSANQSLFGGHCPSPLSGSDVKVAVTATSYGDQTVVLANYNRQHSGPLPYHFRRPDTSSAELKVWEAARATSATKRLFKPFHHKLSKQFFANDPSSDSTITVAALEWRAIWHDLEQDYPDILLSLGTGYNPLPKSPTISERRSWIGSTASGRLGLNSSNDAFLADRQSAWDSYATQLPDSALGRFIRLNPEFGEDLPAADDVSGMKSLQRMVWDHAGLGIEIRMLAPRLLASLFYFELSEPILEALDNSFIAKGDILCRLPPTSPGILGLGKFIKENSSDEPSFLIRDVTTGSSQRIKFGEAIIGTIRERQFELGTQTIAFPSKDSVTEVILSLNMTGYGKTEEMISGFPRSLFSNDSFPSKHYQPAITSSSRWVSSPNSRQTAWTAPDLRKASKITAANSSDDSESGKRHPAVVLQSASDRPVQPAGASSRSVFRPSARSPTGTHPSPIGLQKAGPQTASAAQPTANREPVELDAIREPAELDSQPIVRNLVGRDPDARELDAGRDSRPDARLPLGQTHQLGISRRDQLGQRPEAQLPIRQSRQLGAPEQDQLGQRPEAQLPLKQSRQRVMPGQYQLGQRPDAQIPITQSRQWVMPGQDQLDQRPDGQLPIRQSRQLGAPEQDQLGQRPEAQLPLGRSRQPIVPGQDQLGQRPVAQPPIRQSRQLGAHGQDQPGQSSEGDQWVQQYGQGRKLAQDRPIGQITTEKPKRYISTTPSREKPQAEETKQATKNPGDGPSQAKQPGHEQGAVAALEPEQLPQRLKEIGIFSTAIKALYTIDGELRDKVLSAMCYWGKRRPSEAGYYVVSQQYPGEWPQGADPDVAILIYRLVLQEVARKDKATEERVRDAILQCSQDSNAESAWSVFEMFDQDLGKDLRELADQQDERETTG